jgi:hypothetical protein
VHRAAASDVHRAATADVHRTPSVTTKARVATANARRITT